MDTLLYISVFLKAYPNLTMSYINLIYVCFGRKAVLFLFQVLFRFGLKKNLRKYLMDMNNISHSTTGTMDSRTLQDITTMELYLAVQDITTMELYLAAMQRHTINSHSTISCGANNFQKMLSITERKIFRLFKFCTLKLNSCDVSL